MVLETEKSGQIGETGRSALELGDGLAFSGVRKGGVYIN